MPFVADEIVTAAKLNASTILWGAVCQVRRTSQSIANNSVTTIAYNSETDILDPLAWHDTTSNPSRVVPNIAGWYQAHVGTEWQSDTDYTRLYTTILRNGADLSPICRQETGDDFSGAAYFDLLSPFVLMNGTTDYFEVTCFQTNVSAGANTVGSVLTVKLEYTT